VVGPNDGGQFGHPQDVGEEVRRAGRMGVHDHALVIGQLARRVEDLLVDEDLADVVELGTDLEILLLLATQTQTFGQAQGHVADVLGVTPGVVVLAVQGDDHHPHDVDLRFDPQVLVLADVLLQGGDGPWVVQRARTLVDLLQGFHLRQVAVGG